MNRRSTPKRTARALAREAAFRYARCFAPPDRKPHHIRPYHQSPGYDPAHMIWLCQECHEAADRGSITREELYAIKESLKMARPLPQGHLAFEGSQVFWAPDGCIFENIRYWLVADNQVLLGATPLQGSLVLNATFYDPEHRVVARIDQNRWWTPGDRAWDVDSGPAHLRITNSWNQLSISLDIISWLVKFTGLMYFRGHRILITDDYLDIAHRRCSNVSFKGLGNDAAFYLRSPDGPPPRGRVFFPVDLPT